MYFSTLFTTNPHSKLKGRWYVDTHFFCEKQSYFVKKKKKNKQKKTHADLSETFSNIVIIKILQFLIDNMFIMFCGGVLQRFIVARSRSLVRWCNYHHYDLVNSISMLQMATDLYHSLNPALLSSFMTFHRIFN